MDSGKRRNPERRVLWMDVFRGILILSVVLGHATGRYNAYIYQFHMGAFFFASGYMSRQERRGVLESVYHRALTVFLPVCTAICLLLIVTSILDLTKTYSIFFGENSPYMGIVFSLKEFALHGNIYVWWLGAAWFVLVLFTASIINRILFEVCGKQYSFFYGLLVCVMFLIGYWAVQRNISNWYVDLAFLASFYYGVGAIVQTRQRILEQISEKKMLCCILLAVSVAIMGKVVPCYQWTMDFPSRRFNGPLIDAAIVFNGICFVFFLSAVLDAVPGVNGCLRYLGKNTLPVVLFHFIWFELGYYILYLTGIVPFSYIQNFVPTEEIGNRFWPLFLLLGVVGSLLTWKLLMKSKMLRFLFGQEKKAYHALYQKILAKPVPNRETAEEGPSSSENMGIRNVRVWPIVLGVICVGVISGKMSGTATEQILLPFHVEMPCSQEEAAVFGDGWHPQMDNETYRWVEKESTLQLNYSWEHNVFVLEGYVPEEFHEVNLISVYLDQTQICEVPAAAGTAISVAQDISGVLEHDGIVSVKIVFNAEHIPQKDALDQRVMSALVTKVGFLMSTTQ